MNDFSLDLETLGTKYNAAILSIGCVQFDRINGKLGGSFYAEIDLASSIKSGSISADTLEWWVCGAGQKANRVFQKSDRKLSLATALDELRGFIVRNESGGGAIVWGNGSSFDITILEHAYDKGAVGLAHPWKFWNIRDMRTIVEAAEVDPKNWPFTNNAMAHNALDDATRQAQIIHAALSKIRKALHPAANPAAGGKPVPKVTSSKDLSTFHAAIGAADKPVDDDEL